MPPPSSPLLSRHRWLRHRRLRQGIRIGIHSPVHLFAEHSQKRLLLKQTEPTEQAQQIHRCGIQMPRILLTPRRQAFKGIAIWCGYSGLFLRLARCGLRDF